MFKKLAVSSFLTVVAMGHASFADAATPSHTDGGAHEASSGLPQLDPSSFASQTFWLFLIFILMYVFFARKSLPQISQTIETRAERVKNDLDSAERLKEEVEAVQTSYEEKLAEARAESSAVFTKIEEDIKAKSEKHASEFQERSAKKVAELEKNIEQARKKAMDEMSDVAAEVSAEAAEKIIGVRADQKSAKAVVKSLNKAA